MTRPLGFAILGAGLVAPFHARAVRGAKGARLVAICDSDRGRADRLAAEFGARAYYELGRMLADPEIDAVNVALPNHLHRDAVLQSAAAGKHVLTEKPPAMSLAQVDEMIGACRQAGVRFGCTVQCRVRRSVQAVRAALAAGRFGRLLHADVFMKWYRSEEYYRSDGWRSSRRSGAGVTVQQAFHYVDLLQHLAGPVRSVQARMTNLAHPAIDLEDTAVAFLDFECGARGLLQASTALWPGTDVRVEINGTNGTAILVGEKVAAWRVREELAGDAEARMLGADGGPTAAGGAADFGHEGHQVLVQDLVDSVREGREVVIPVASVRHSLEIVLAMYQSAARGQAVDLPVEDDETAWGSQATR